MVESAVLLLHVLVLVYWLGGDLGAFMASRVLTDRSADPAARVSAAKLLGNLDMAPRTALILSLPTGTTLAIGRGWIGLPNWYPLPPEAALMAIWLFSAGWVWLVWHLHQAHIPPGHLLRTIDLAIRWVALAKLAVLATGLVPEAMVGEIPPFLQIKFGMLAACIGCGLLIRKILAPFGAAFQSLAANGPSLETDNVISSTLARARPIVVLLWGLLLAAAWVGIAKPM